MKYNKRITLPLGEILDSFGIKRQSFYEINRKYKVFTKEKRGYYSAKLTAYKEIKDYYQKKKPRNMWQRD